MAARTIITAPSVYPADDGVRVALHADGSQCPAASRASEPLFTGPALAGLRYFQTLSATRDRLYVAADGALYAFAF